MILGNQFDWKALLRDRGSSVAIITDSHVETLIAREVETCLRSQGFKTCLIAFPAGEAQKTRETKAWIEDQMLAQKLGKESCVLAIGGGTVTDLAGFVATTYCRGIPYLSMPTTLLAMVDAAIGGKTGVNTKEGKNLIGAFYLPDELLINPEFLLTLPFQELKNGMAEILKAGLIASVELFDLLIHERKAIQNCDLLLLTEIIKKSIAIKQQVVQEDPLEKGLRRILNLGHTIGHAIETVEQYQIPHGEAVGMGIALEANLSAKLGHLSQNALEKVQQTLLDYGFQIDLPKSLSLQKLKTALLFDKKTLHSQPRFVALKAIGEVEPFAGAYCTPLNWEDLDDLFAH
jgi:3-dehydroquinate synthase